MAGDIDSDLWLRTDSLRRPCCDFLCWREGAPKENNEQAEIDTRSWRAGQVEVAALQHRVFALWGRRQLLAVTNSRIIRLKRHIFGGFEMADIQWKDLLDAKIKQNTLPAIAGSNLEFAHSNAKVPRLHIKGIGSDEASAMYAFSQSEEHAWEEKRRVRDMEEVRAASGGVVIHAPNPQANEGAYRHSVNFGEIRANRNARDDGLGQTATRPNTMMEQIAAAKALLDSGAISDAEFQEIKSKILSHA